MSRSPLLPLRARCAKALAVACSVASVAGCASTNWERAFYEGWRAPKATGAATDPSAVPRQALPPHAQYEREREALRAGAPRETAASGAR